MMSSSQRSGLMVPTCPWCPTGEAMVSDGPLLHDTNFDQWQCSRCGHHGATPTTGTQLVFRGGDEFIFTFGASMRSMTVKLSPEVIDFFRNHRIAPEDLARRMAEWALLRGWSEGRVCLTSSRDELMSFQRYCSLDKGDHKAA